MSYLIFLLKSALFDFSRNKGRTILTSLGILIGVLSVLLLVSFGLGLQRYIDQTFQSLAPNLLRIIPGKIVSGGQFRGGPGSIGGIRFDEKDVARLERISSLDYVLPEMTKTVTVSGGGKSGIYDYVASTDKLFDALNVQAQFGRLFTRADVNKRTKIAVIGPKVATKLFGSPENAVGNKIKIESQSFKITGVTQSKGGGSLGADFDGYIYLPYKAAFVFDPDKKFVALIAKVKKGQNTTVAKGAIEKVLLKRYNEDDFSVVEQTELLGAITSVFNVVNTVLVAIAAISLLVGGIGIMNIMYVTVTERIKEIGIRRAIGARKSDILYQFLIESVILSLLGGVSGLVLAFIIVFFIQSVFPAYINLQTILLALGVSSAIGIIFGVFPAKKAADLSPIEAIRYE